MIFFAQILLNFLSRLSNFIVPFMCNSCGNNGHKEKLPINQQVSLQGCSSRGFDPRQPCIADDLSKWLWYRSFLQSAFLLIM
jgi:hypothetical protein